MTERDDMGTTPNMTEWDSVAMIPKKPWQPFPGRHGTIHIIMYGIRVPGLSEARWRPAVAVR